MDNANNFKERLKPISVAEARKAVKKIKPLLIGLNEYYNEFEDRYLQLEQIAKNNPTTEDLLTARFQVDLAEEQLSILRREINKHNCILRDWKLGIVDFLSSRNGEAVWLCYRLGETNVLYYHEYNQGYNQRKIIDFE